jgi:hypothetical protein
MTVYIWGVQWELGAAATSYIPTTTATVTRAATVISVANPAGLNNAEGLVRCSMWNNYVTGNNTHLFNMQTGGGSIPLYIAAHTQIVSYDGVNWGTLNVASILNRWSSVQGWWSSALGKHGCTGDRVSNAGAAYDNTMIGTSIVMAMTPFMGIMKDIVVYKKNS